MDRMTPPEERHRYREQIGAFLLGKLDGVERAAMQAHVDSCPACQAEVRELEPVVAALAFAAPDRIGEAPQPPADLEESTLAPILGEKHRARRHRSWFRSPTLAAAAICVVVVGLAGFAGFLQPAVSLELLKNAVRLEISTRGGELVVFTAKLPNESRVADSEKQKEQSPGTNLAPADSQNEEPTASGSGGGPPPKGSTPEGGNKGPLPGDEKPGTPSPETASPERTLDKGQNDGGSYEGQAACDQYSCAQE
jgi:Putative zinc-finger